MASVMEQMKDVVAVKADKSALQYIVEEKANKVLERLDMFKKLRQEIVLHPNLDERLLLALDNHDLPEWWIPGKHDRDLLFGVAK